MREPSFCRNRQFYGKKLIEIYQKPGEVIYMPNYQSHAVYNMDETVAVTDNPYFNTAIEESAFQLMHQKYITFGKMSGNEVSISPG